MAYSLLDFAKENGLKLQLPKCNFCQFLVTNEYVRSLFQRKRTCFPMMQMFIQKMNRVKTIVYHWRSYSSIVNNLFANSQTLKCLIETDIDPLPSFSSLSDCIKGAHAASNFSLLRRNRSQSFSVALFDDERSVNEELSTIVHYSGERISINGRKYWIWYPSEEKPESVLLALLSDNGAQLSIEMPISETMGAIQTTMQSYDASLLCCHLQIDVKDFPMNELS